MTGLEIITLGAVTAACLFLLLFLFFLILFIRTSKECKKYAKKRAKSPKKKRQLARKRRVLNKEKKNLKKAWAIFFTLSLLCFGGSGIGAYYQAITLSKEDEESVVNGYFLINDFEEQLENAKNKSESKEKIEGNISYLANIISSYGAKKSSPLNSEEGQLSLNRYYRAMQEIGTNAVRVSTGFYGDEELAMDYQKDIERVRRHQKKVFDLYQVNEEALKQAKK